MNKTSPSTFPFTSRFNNSKTNIQTSQPIKAELNSVVKFIGYFPPIKKSTQQYTQTLKWDSNIKSYVPLAHKKQKSKQSSNNNTYFENGNLGVNTNTSTNVNVNMNNININANNGVNPIRILSEGNTIGLIDCTFFIYLQRILMPGY